MPYLTPEVVTAAILAALADRIDDGMQLPAYNWFTAVGVSLTITDLTARRWWSGRPGKSQRRASTDVPCCSRVTIQGALSPTARSANTSTPWGFAPNRTSPLRCSPSRPSYPPRSSPGCSASTSRSPSSGRKHRPGTGPSTPPMSAVATARDACVSALLRSPPVVLEHLGRP